MKQFEYTVIIPCAGKATRLSSPVPKELMPITSDKVAIDFTMEKLIPYHETTHLVFVINEFKLELVRYLINRYGKTFKMDFTLQTDNADYVGAINSAYHLFSDNNLVMLPDSRISFYSDRFLEESTEALWETGFTFFLKEEYDLKKLAVLGAVAVRDGLVFDYRDKLRWTENPACFNAYWTAFAFRKRVWGKCYDYMLATSMGSKLPDFQKTSMYNSKPVYVHGYDDMGTWSNVIKVMHETNSD